jgi:hypothetical protein
MKEGEAEEGSMKRRIYVVMGHTGEYSDHSDWPIRAVATEDRAKALVTELDEEARRVGLLSRRHEMVDPKIAAQSSIVKNFQDRFGGEWVSCGYTGYDFDYFAVELEDE